LSQVIASWMKGFHNLHVFEHLHVFQRVSKYANLPEATVKQFRNILAAI